MSSPAVWTPILLFVVLIGLILNVVRHDVAAAFRRLALANYRKRLFRWSNRRSELQGLVEEAKTAKVLDDSGSAYMARAGFSYNLRRGEGVYRLLTGTMVEERSRQNVPTLIPVATGAIAITSSRLLFEGGGTRREWAFGKLHSIRLVGSETSLLGVTNRKALSGIKYGDSERTRMYLDLAIAEFRGSRASVVAEMRTRLATHESRRPKEPRKVDSRKFSARDRGVLLCCAALLLWPVIPALLRAFSPTARPSWGWLVAAALPALFGLKDLLKSAAADVPVRPKRPLVRRGLTVAAVAVVLVVGGGLAVPASALEGTVERVVDGDTIVVNVTGNDLRVRVLNIDTPETVNSQAPDECLGQEASAYTKQLVPPGTRVNLKFDKERTDRYGRTLAAVTLSDGRSVANELAKAGLGLPVIVGDNDTYFDPVLAAFKQAQASERGYFDPTIECTYPAQQARIKDDLAAAKAAEAGITAAEAAAAAAAVFVLYEAHSAMSRLIGAGISFSVRAMKVVGATAGFAAYRAHTESIGRIYRELDSIASERARVELEVRRKREAEERAAAEAAKRAEEERARRESEQSSGGWDDDDDFNVPGWACPTRWC